MGHKIKELRKDRGWNQKQLADRLGVHPQTVSDAERGKNRFTIERLLRFFDALGYKAEINLQEKSITKKHELADIQKKLTRHRAELKKEFDVRRIGVFGSTARGEADKSSDIDLLVKFEPGKEGGGIKLQKLKKRISKWFDQEVDLTPSYSLSDEEFARAVKKEISYV